MRRFPFSSLPNLITLGRLILVPVVISAIANGRWATTFLAFVLAGASDGIDGYLAKRFDLRTELGAYLDPVADKVLLVSVYAALAVVNVLPATLVIIVVSRDVMIVGGVLIAWVLDNPLEIRPLLVSKLNTTAQITFAAAVLAAKAFAMPLGPWFDVSAVFVGALTLASAGAYLRQWIEHVID